MTTIVALKVDYVVKETGRNLVRNPLLTHRHRRCASPSPSRLVGVSLLIRQAVNNATERWQGGIEFIVYMNPDATPGADRRRRPGPRREPAGRVATTYLDKDAAFEEYREIFEEDSPELVERGHARRPADVVQGQADRPRARGRRLADPAVLPRSPASTGSSPPPTPSGRSSASPTSSRSPARPGRRRAEPRRRAAHRLHHPDRGLLPPPGDRGDEARRRHELVHPRPVHARGRLPGRPGRARRHRRASTSSTASSTACAATRPSASSPTSPSPPATCSPPRSLLLVVTIVFTAIASAVAVTFYVNV